MDAESLPARCHVEAWTPRVPGIREVFHAHLVDYAYPPHCHETWAVLIVDDGAIRYDLDRRERFAAGQTVTILPPGVPHDGGPAPGAAGFRKREFYLDDSVLSPALAGAAVDRAAIIDGPLRVALDRLHRRLADHGADRDLDAEARLALICERITGHLTRAPLPPASPSGRVARQLRELLDSRFTGDVSLSQAAALLDRSVPHLVRSFTREFGLSPHAYVTSRRVDAARRLLLGGTPPAEVAAEVGFYDQAHLTRHFRRHTSVTPAAYARSHPRAGLAQQQWEQGGLARCRRRAVAPGYPGAVPGGCEADTLPSAHRYGSLGPLRLGGRGELGSVHQAAYQRP